MKKPGEAGLSLIELVVVIVVVGIMASASALFVREVVNLWEYMSFRTEAVAISRQALGRVSRDIRRIKNTTAVTLASATALRFVNAEDAAVNYTYSSGNLSRNGVVLVQGLSTFGFTYYNNTSAAIASPLVAPSATNIRRVAFSLTIAGPGQNKTVSTQVSPRNLRE